MCRTGRVNSPAFLFLPGARTFQSAAIPECSRAPRFPITLDNLELLGTVKSAVRPWPFGNCPWPDCSSNHSSVLKMLKYSPVLVLIAVVGVIAFCCIVVSGPASEPIGLGLQSYTNASAVVRITNRSFYQFNYVVVSERKIGGEWPKGLRVGTSIPADQFGSLCPGQLTNLTIPLMVYAPPYPWRISVFCTRHPVQPNSLRFKAGAWALNLGMRKLAHTLLGGDSKQIQASTQEMEQ